MDLKEVNRLLNNFGKNVVFEAKANAPREKVSGKLRDGLYYLYSFDSKGAQIAFYMEEYGKYQDLGVKGTKSGESVGKKYYGNEQREYKYTTKMPPPNKLDRFVVRKGLAPRDKRGRFLGRSFKTVGFQKSITFLIARSIFGKGIKPTLFFTKPFLKYYDNLPQQLAEAFGNDFEVSTKKIINN